MYDQNIIDQLMDEGDSKNYCPFCDTDHQGSHCQQNERDDHYV